MRSTNKMINRLICSALIATVCLTGCATAKTSDYDLLETSYQYGIAHTSDVSKNLLYGSTVAISDGTDIGTDQVDSQVCTNAGCFNSTTRQTLYAQSVHEKIYPASTTKILTAYVALKYGNIDDTITVSENAVAAADVDQSSNCSLKVGDHLTLRQLIYGMMLRSGNDAAVAIAEGVSGSVDEFMELCNKEAAALGATNTHFVTPNGLHDDDHYTTVYDMYLIFNAATELPEFVNIIATKSYDAYYTDASGNSTSQTWANTNQYITGSKSAPKGITIIGGKSGTTSEAAYCLVTLAENEAGDKLISLVYHADCRYNLYLLTNELFSTFGRSDAEATQ